MTWPVTANPDRFDEAVAWFQRRFPVTEAIMAALGQYAGDRAWTVAGIAQLDVVLDVFRSLERAIAESTPLDQWKREIGEKLYAAWGKKESARIETIFLTNVQSAYNAGRWRQVKDPLVVEARPFLGYDAILDDRTSPVCKRCNGAILPADDPWWDTHVPPLHHRCRSTVRSFTKREAERRGGVKHPGEDTEQSQPDEGFGKAPDTAAPWEPDLGKYPDELRRAFQGKRAASKIKRVFTKEDHAAAGIEFSGSPEKTIESLDRLIGTTDPAAVRGIIGIDRVSPGSTIKATRSIGKDGNERVTVETQHNGIEVKRTIWRDKGALVINNDEFSVDRQGKGTGRRILAAQLAEYRKRGVDRVELVAVSVGQYIWPRMGYELINPAAFSDVTRRYASWLRDFSGGLPESLASAPTSMHDIAVQTVAGRQVGKEFLLWSGEQAVGLRMKLDINGAGGRIADEYVKARKKRRKR